MVVLVLEDVVKSLDVLLRILGILVVVFVRIEANELDRRGEIFLVTVGPDAVHLLITLVRETEPEVQHEAEYDGDDAGHGKVSVEDRGEPVGEHEEGGRKDNQPYEPQK